MISEVRREIYQSMEDYRDFIQPDNKGWEILEIGIDGDEKPSGNFKYFGEGNKWKTMDNFAKVEPDILADITGNDLKSEQWDLIICSQVLEHLWDFKKAIEEIYRLLKFGGFAIIDNPWMWPYHGLEAYDDYWRFSERALKKLLADAGFTIVKSKPYNYLVSCLVMKQYE